MELSPNWPTATQNQSIDRPQPQHFASHKCTAAIASRTTAAPSSQWRGILVLCSLAKQREVRVVNCFHLLQWFHISQPPITYYCTGIIACQSIQRRLAAQKIVEVLRKERCVLSVTSIQTKWRSTISRREFVDTISKVLLVQSTICRRAAERSFSRHKKAATLISCQWRRLRCLLMFKTTLKSEFTTLSVPNVSITCANWSHLRQISSFVSRLHVVTLPSRRNKGHWMSSAFKPNGNDYDISQFMLPFILLQNESSYKYFCNVSLPLSMMIISNNYLQI